MSETFCGIPIRVDENVPENEIWLFGKDRSETHLGRLMGRGVKFSGAMPHVDPVVAEYLRIAEDQIPSWASASAQVRHSPIPAWAVTSKQVRRLKAIIEPEPRNQ